MREPEPVCHPEHMGIYRDSLLSKGAPEYYISGFSSDAWKGDKLIHGLRDFSMEIFRQSFAAVDYCLRLAPEISYAGDLPLKVPGVSLSKLFSRAVSPEERFSDLIYSDVGTLRGKDRCNK